MKHNIKGWLHADRLSPEHPWCLKIYPFATSIGNSVIIKEVEVTVDVPEDYDFEAAEKASLRQEYERQQKYHATSLKAWEDKMRKHGALD